MAARPKIVLAYSGGLDTSVILKWLIEKGFDVIAYTSDVGQGEELEPVRPKALKTGAKKIYIEDLREEFAKNYVWWLVKWNAYYEGQYMLGTSIARPLIAKRQVEIALKEKADYIGHGATGKGNDQVRFELTAYALAPKIKIIAPWREPDWNLNSRTKMIDYARKHGIPVPVTTKKPYSSDRNLLHISYESGILEDPWAAPPEDLFVLTVSPENAPDKPEIITVDFVKGEAVAVNGKAMTPAALLAKLNVIGGRNGVGRVDLVENRFVGMKSRGVYETPGGTILYAAHRAVESLTMDREVMLLRDQLMPKFAQLVYNGFWFSPEMDALKTFINETQRNVTGTAKLKLYKGSVTTIGRKSPRSLYNTAIATFEEDSVYNQADATGFIRLNALRLRLRKAAAGR
ncbi:argininosuccinate synthase [bacterium]|nr:argininosuccinate synthase [bacterium]